MGSTFLKLTNKLLQRINETELTSTNFVSTRGIHSLAKDCILDSIREIDQQKWLWPFNAVSTTQVLTVGENEYEWPAYFKSVDWNSFQIQKDDTLSVQNTHLRPINRDEWYSNLRDYDEDTDPDGYKTPVYVFRGHGNKYGISPSPDKAYTLEYRYYQVPTTMEAFDDTTTIPSEFDNVIIWGALVHMNLFKENPEGSAIARQNFDIGIKNMYNFYLGNVQESVTDTRVNFGGTIMSRVYQV